MSLVDELKNNGKNILCRVIKIMINDLKILIWLNWDVKVLNSIFKIII